MHERTIATYDERAERWSETRGTANASGLANAQGARRVRQLAGDGIVLDLGCGPGHLFEAIGRPVVGVDASSGMLGLARSRVRDVPLVQADLERLPMPDGSAAGGFGNFSYQHLPRPAFDRALAEVVRVLRPGGVVQLAMHAGDYEGDDRPGDDMPGRWFTYWREEPLRAHLEAAGLDVVDIAVEVYSLRATAVSRREGNRGAAAGRRAHPSPR